MFGRIYRPSWLRERREKKHLQNMCNYDIQKVEELLATHPQYDKLRYVLNPYRERLSRVKNIAELHELGNTINLIATPLMMYPQIIPAFYNTDTVSLDEEDVNRHLQSENEQSGTIIANTRHINGQRDLHLSLRWIAEGTPTQARSREEMLEENEIGYWHTHPSGIPIPSVGDMEWYAAAFFYFPNLIISKSGSRLYFHRYLTELVSPTLQAKMVPFSVKDREDETLSGINDLELRAKQRELFVKFEASRGEGFGLRTLEKEPMVYISF